MGRRMDDLVPFGSARPYQLEPGATGYRLFCISNALLPCMSGCLSDNLEQFTPDAEELLTLEVLSLTSSVCLTEIISRLDAILHAVNTLDVCCALSQGNPGLEEPPDPIERGVGDPPAGASWAEYDDLLCQSLQLQIDLTDEVADTLTDGLGALGLIGLDMLAVYLAPVLPPVALLLAILSVLTAILEDELYDQWAGELGLYAHDAICAGFLAYTPGTAKTAIDAVIDKYVTPPPNRLFHKALWSQTQINRIFNIELEGYEGYDPNYCDVCTFIPMDEWHFAGSLEGWFFVEGQGDSELTYNPAITHTADGTGCAQLYLDYHWYGQWHSRAQVNTYVEVVADQHVEIWHSQLGDIRESILQIYFDDETEYLEVIDDPLDYPSWRHSVVNVPAAHIGKHIVALRYSWQGNDDYVYFDDITIYVA